MNPLLYPSLVEVALITYRDVRKGNNTANPIKYLPIPSQYVSVIIVYGGLSFAPPSAQRLAALIGWGFVVATALNVWTPGSTVNSVKAGGPIAPGVTSGGAATQ
jgi:hypothetical protein